MGTVVVVDALIMNPMVMNSVVVMNIVLVSIVVMSALIMNPMVMGTVVVMNIVLVSPVVMSAMYAAVELWSLDVLYVLGARELLSPLQVGPFVDFLALFSDPPRELLVVRLKFVDDVGSHATQTAHRCECTAHEFLRFIFASRYLSTEVPTTSRHSSSMPRWLSSSGTVVDIASLISISNVLYSVETSCSTDDLATNQAKQK